MAKVKANIKRKGQTTTDTLQENLGAELRNISQDAAANIPSTSTLRRNIRKAREDNDVPHNPVTREDLHLIKFKTLWQESRHYFLIVVLRIKNECLNLFQK